MNKNHGLTAENLLAALPRVLQEDESMQALAAAVAEVLAGRAAEIDSLRIYSRIDELAEEMLDILAYDFKVDWWDGNYTLEEKRRTLKDSWRVHRMLGTKAAVETAISAIYPDTKVLEWFEYGGEPYHFKLEIDATYEGADAERHKRILSRVDYYKNLRSHLDGVEYIVYPPKPAEAYVAAAHIGQVIHMGVELDTGDADHPHGYVRAKAAAAMGGMRIVDGAEVAVNDDFRRGAVNISAGVILAGTYSQIYTEVT